MMNIRSYEFTGREKDIIALWECENLRGDIVKYTDPVSGIGHIQLINSPLVATKIRLQMFITNIRYGTKWSLKRVA